jgi:hypothetical protein
MNFLLEAIVVGIITLIVGIIVSKLMEIGRKKIQMRKIIPCKWREGYFWPALSYIFYVKHLDLIVGIANMETHVLNPTDAKFEFFKFK